MLAALIIIGGLYPQPNIASRYRASEELIGVRRKQGIVTTAFSNPVESAVIPKELK